MNRHKETPVRNYPGIYKEHVLNADSGKWIETGKYRAVRRITVEGRSKREQRMFGNFEDARNFRRGIDENLKSAIQKLTFEQLVNEWKPFHYLKLEHSTQQTYDKRLPNLSRLNLYRVEDITTPVIDELVQYWVRHLPKKKSRENFEKELNLLKVILHFYKRRRNPSFVMPVLLEHYQAADVAKKAERPVQSLSQEELRKFLEELRTAKCSHFYPLALAQFCLGLRIGEACGLYWDAIDLEKRVAKIEWTIVWDHLTWEPIVKKRPKNGKVRMLVIPEVLAAELERVRANRVLSVPFVFHKKDGMPLNRQVVAKAYNRALERLGYDHVRGTHMLRKTAATLANEITGDFYAVSKLMDHSNPNVTLRYVSQNGVQKQKVADALNSVLVRHSEEKPDPQNVDNADTPIPIKPVGFDRPRLTLVYSK